MKYFQIPILLILLVVGCKEEYEPKVKSSEQSLLVVEGFLNTGEGPTTITLTRTFKLDDSAVVHPVLGAQLVVEATNGTQFPLTDVQNDGNYYAQQLEINPSEQYRLRINTADGKEYLSDFVRVKQAPLVDSISWRRNKEGVHLYVSTHDDQNATWYYKWDFEETWELRSTLFSTFKMVGDVIVERTPEEYVNVCWRNAQSSSINIGSSAKLQSDVIHMRPLWLVPDASEKMAVRYSLLVKQYALSKEAYEFYRLMEKNTETLGSIFDAQPSELSSNIHNISNPEENVIGYVWASSVAEKRLFIDRAAIGWDWGFSLSCISYEVVNHPDSIRAYFPYPYYPYNAKYADRTILSYYGSQIYCSDCTSRGGSTVKPSFW